MSESSVTYTGAHLCKNMVGKSGVRLPQRLELHDVLEDGSKRTTVLWRHGNRWTVENNPASRLEALRAGEGITLSTLSLRSRIEELQDTLRARTTRTTKAETRVAELSSTLACLNAENEALSANAAKAGSFKGLQGRTEAAEEKLADCLLAAEKILAENTSLRALTAETDSGDGLKPWHVVLVCMFSTAMALCGAGAVLSLVSAL